VEFLLLVSPATRSGASAELLGSQTGRAAAWVARRRAEGVVVAGGHLDGETVVGAVDGEPSAIEAYLVVEARDMAAALAIADDCPWRPPGTVRVFPVDPEGRL
jgi:hypothetical protein